MLPINSSTEYLNFHMQNEFLNFHHSKFLLNSQKEDLTIFDAESIIQRVFYRHSRFLICQLPIPAFNRQEPVESMHLKKYFLKWAILV